MTALDHGRLRQQRRRTSAFQVQEALLINIPRFRTLADHPPSAQNMRALFLFAATTFGPAPYLILEDERYTYAETFALVSRAASIFREAYGVRKGDRVGIVMRNYPQVSFVVPGEFPDGGSGRHISP